MQVCRCARMLLGKYAGLQVWRRGFRMCAGVIVRCVLCVLCVLRVLCLLCVVLCLLFVCAVCVQCVCRVYAKVPRYAGVQGASVHHVQVCMCAGVQVRMC